MAALDRHLYGAGDSPWDGTALWNAVQSGLRDKPRPSATDSGNDIGTLYPRRR